MQTAQRIASVSEYYFSKKLREVRGLAAQGYPIINMGIGSPDLAPPEAVVEALQQGLTHPNAHKYQSYQGLPELRQAMADFYQKQYGVGLNPENQILPLMGSKEGIMHISMAFLNPGDQVLIPNPGYPTYSSVTRLVEAEALYYDLDAENDWLPDFDALSRQDLSKVKLMWVNYPHMPTGAKGNIELFADLVAFAKAHNILVINDNPYSFILNDAPESLLAADPDFSNVMELNSLSKAYNMAGWRVGMLSGSADNIAHVLKVKSNMDSGMFYGLQLGAVAALQQTQTWFGDMNSIYQKRRERMWELASLLGCTFDRKTAGMFVWAKLPEGSPDSESFIDKVLYKQHVFITPGTIFGSAGAGYIRFSLCVPVEQIEEAISRWKA
ncbi:MAG: pyridoxal phosphate-dependent aminotransferase [Flavobacteriaceae bacterium]